MIRSIVAVIDKYFDRLARGFIEVNIALIRSPLLLIIPFLIVVTWTSNMGIVADSVLLSWLWFGLKIFLWFGVVLFIGSTLVGYRTSSSHQDQDSN